MPNATPDQEPEPTEFDLIVEGDDRPGRVFKMGGVWLRWRNPPVPCEPVEFPPDTALDPADPHPIIVRAQTPDAERGGW